MAKSYLEPILTSDMREAKTLSFGACLRHPKEACRASGIWVSGENQDNNSVVLAVLLLGEDLYSLGLLSSLRPNIELA
jgi:hypothetical protein